jgi:DnaJ-class molecular chaperone
MALGWSCDGRGWRYCPDCQDGRVKDPSRPYVDVPCRTCGGVFVGNERMPGDCPSCRGWGEVRQPNLITCPRCRGTDKETCPSCGGAGCR